MDEAFEQYVHARGRVLLRFAYVLCGDHHLAEDLVQEVLAKAHRRWSRIEAEQPDAYLRQALVRTHLSWWRRLSNRETPREVMADSAGPDFAQHMAVRDELWRLLASLPKAQRTVLVLRFFEDLDDARIAEVMACSQATVRVHAFRGLSKLRSSVSPREVITA